MHVTDHVGNIAMFNYKLEHAVCDRCTIVPYYRKGYPPILNIDERSQVVPFLRAGHIYFTRICTIYMGLTQMIYAMPNPNPHVILYLLSGTVHVHVNYIV